VDVLRVGGVQPQRHSLPRLRDRVQVGARDDVTGLFEPFRRLSGRTGIRPGTGLGLSIVASVANAHGGHAKAQARADGGLDVQITLPATANEHRPAAHQPQTLAPQIWQPDHCIPPAADQGHATAE
jgi:Histidine kinase-, DNA gyrase B-, and HSP90-like ATPase